MSSSHIAFNAIHIPTSLKFISQSHTLLLKPKLISPTPYSTFQFGCLHFIPYMPQTEFPSLLPQIFIHIPLAPNSIDGTSIFQFVQAKNRKSHLRFFSCIHTLHLICQEDLDSTFKLYLECDYFSPLLRYHSALRHCHPLLGLISEPPNAYFCSTFPHSNQNEPVKIYVRSCPSFSPRPSSVSHLRVKARVLLIAYNV